MKHLLHSRLQNNIHTDLVLRHMAHFVNICPNSRDRPVWSRNRARSEISTSRCCWPVDISVRRHGHMLDSRIKRNMIEVIRRCLVEKLLRGLKVKTFSWTGVQQPRNVVQADLAHA